MLLPYNCLLIAQPYFDRHAFAGLGFPFTSMLCYAGPLCVGQVLLTLAGSRFTTSGRMLTSFISAAAVCLALQTVTMLAYLDPNNQVAIYVFCLATIVALSCVNALMQTTLMGLAGAMGLHMSAAAMCGFGVSGLLALGLSLLLEVVLPGGEDSGVRAACKAAVLFSACALYTIGSACVYHFFFTRKVQAAIDALKELDSPQSQALSEGSSPTAALLKAVSSSFYGNSWIPRSTIAVLREIAPQALNVWCVFAVTLAIFPGVIGKWIPGEGSMFEQDPDLFTQLLTGSFQVFDVLGRYAAEPLSAHIAPRKLWILVVLRLLFIPAFVLGQRRPELCALWGSDLGRFLLVSLMAFSNGFTACCAMMFGPQQCLGERRELAGIGMSSSMVTGIFCGTMLAFCTQL